MDRIEIVSKFGYTRSSWHKFVIPGLVIPTRVYRNSKHTFSAIFYHQKPFFFNYQTQVLKIKTGIAVAFKY